MGILIKVDPIAAGIIAISIISSGLARSLSLAFKCQALTVFQEAIVSRNIESAAVAPLLLRHATLELFLQSSTILGQYGHRRCKKKAKKHLAALLLDAYGALPYSARIDSYNQKRFFFVRPSDMRIN